MHKTVVIIIFLMISCVLQHVSHELLHVFIGKKMGLSINKIQWFTYHGGTKVYFEGEEQVVELNRDIPKEWIYMNLAGIIGTTIFAYLFCAIYFLLDIGYLKLFMWELATIFLLTDSSYYQEYVGWCIWQKGNQCIVKLKFNRPTTFSS